MVGSETYRRGWRISETQDPQCRCLTPLNFFDGAMILSKLLSLVSPKKRERKREERERID